MSFLNNIVNEFDIALKTISNKKSGTDRAYPPVSSEKNTEELTQKQKNLSIQLMRVNLAGEVAAQALYRGQALVCKDPEIKKHLIEAGEEETVWYAGSFAIGAIFGNFGEKVSLGFVEETEKQVVAHIDKHLDKISPNDKETIEILKTMREDEDLHAQQAVDNGGEELKIPVKKIMKFTAKMMTTSSAHI